MSLNYQILIYVSLLLVSVENKVTVTTIGDGTDEGGFLCKGKATVMCAITSYAVTMTWEVDGKVASDCTFSSCRTYTTSHFAFAFDTDKGIFNITMDPVIYLYNGKTFKCDDGYTSAYSTLLVKVLPTSSTVQIVSEESAENTKIKVTTGCIHPSSSLTIKWFYFKAGNMATPYMDKGFISTDEYGCTSGQCGGPGVVKVTNTIIIQEDPNGENYHFQALVQHPDTPDIVAKSARTFKLKGDSEVDVSTESSGAVKSNIGLRVPSGSQTLFIILSGLILKNQFFT